MSEGATKMRTDDAGEKSGRRALPIILIVLATIVGIVSVFALWAKRQLLETESWTTTSEELIQDAEIQAGGVDLPRHHDLRQRRRRGRRSPSACLRRRRHWPVRSRARFAAAPTTSP